MIIWGETALSHDGAISVIKDGKIVLPHTQKDIQESRMTFILTMK